MVAAASDRRSSSAPLALAWAALILWATLYPFGPWRWPPGTALADLLRLPWPRYTDGFDILSNLLGYAPLGLLGYIVAVRRGASRLGAVLVVALGNALLSYGLEVTQNLLPLRVPSALDWLLNSAGAAAGALLGWGLHRLGQLGRLRVALYSWVHRRGAGLLLLVLWPVGLLFPTPVPLGLGQVGGALFDLAVDLLSDAPWAAGVLESLLALQPAMAPLGPAAEWLTVTLGFLSPCLLAFAITRPGWRRAVLVGGAAALALGVTTLSTALSFGPEHALAWFTPVSLPALFTGVAAALLLSPVNSRLAAGLGLVAVTALVALVAQAPADPYFAESLEGWERGRFIRFHGLAQWVGWLWPYVAIVWLLRRVGARDEPAPASP
jgi:VanZ family protein